MNIRNGIDNLGQSASAAHESSVASVGNAGPSPGTSTSGTSSSAVSSSGAFGLDQAHLSSAAGLLSAASSGSDIRMEKVTSIQNALAAGTYHVPASAVAAKVVSSMLGA